MEIYIHLLDKLTVDSCQGPRVRVAFFTYSWLGLINV